MLSCTSNQAQADAAQVAPPQAIGPQSSSAAVSGQPASHQEAGVPSTSHEGQQPGNSVPQAAAIPRQHPSQPMSQRDRPQTSMEASGSQQPQPPMVGRMPNLLPQVPQVTVNIASTAAPAPGSVHVLPKAPGNAQELTMQIKQMKNKMIHYASLLDNPVWKQQQPDGGKAVRVCRPTVLLWWPAGNVVLHRGLHRLSPCKGIPTRPRY